jgi:xanthosine utilization system XapX-like protein
VDGLLRGILGILIGAGLYSEVFPLIQDNLLKVGVYGKLTLPGLLGANHWVVIVPMVLGCGALLVWLDRKGL